MNSAEDLGDRGRRKRGWNGYKGDRYRNPFHARSPGSRKRSRSWEKFSEVDQNVGFKSASCRNYGQRGHCARYCKKSFKRGSSQDFKKILPFFKLKKANVETAIHLSSNNMAMVEGREK